MEREKERNAFSSPAVLSCKADDSGSYRFGDLTRRVVRSGKTKALLGAVFSPDLRSTRELREVARARRESCE